MRSIHFLFFFSSAFIILLTGCNSSKEDPVLIAISKGKPVEHYGNYGKWLNAADPSVKWVDMYYTTLDSALLILENCSGLLISGGPDVNPALYGQAHDTARCGKLDLRRDTLEFKLIEKAFQMGIPVLGICRGAQILNVYNGGSLYIDIPTDIDTSLAHRCGDKDTCYHLIRVKPSSVLHEICNIKSCLVNSNHHQAVKRLAEGFDILAVSEDGLTEAIGWLDPANRPFLLGVQWHPERMDTTNALSIPIAKEFIKHARQFSKSNVESNN